MASAATPAPDRAQEVNNAAVQLGAGLAATLAPAHADAIIGLAQEEPTIFSLIMALVHSFRKKKS